MAYDDSILSFDDSSDFEAGEFFGDDILKFARDTTSEGDLSITRLQGQDDASGSGVIAILTFVWEHSGACILEIAQGNLNLYDSDGNPIDIFELEIGTTGPRIN